MKVVGITDFCVAGFVVLRATRSCDGVPPVPASLRPETVHLPNPAILTKTDNKPKSYNPRHSAESV